MKLYTFHPLRPLFALQPTGTNKKTVENNPLTKQHLGQCNPTFQDISLRATNVAIPILSGDMKPGKKFLPVSLYGGYGVLDVDGSEIRRSPVEIGSLYGCFPK